MLTDYQIEYRRKLQDPRWVLKSIEIKERDDNTCRLCKCKHKTLNVHHLNYIWGQDPWDYPDIDLITLCRDCHNDQHKVNLKEKELVLALKLAGFSMDDMQELAFSLRRFKLSDAPRFMGMITHALRFPDLITDLVEVHGVWVEKEIEIQSEDADRAEVIKLFGL